MKRCLYLAMIVGLLAGLLPALLPASPASADPGNYDVKVNDFIVYQNSTDQYTNVVVVNPVAGLGAFDITLGWNTAWIKVNDIVVNPNYLFVKRIGPGATAQITGAWSDWTTAPPSGGDVVVAQVFFDIVGGFGVGPSAITITAKKVSKADGSDGTAGSINGQVTILADPAATNFITPNIPSLLPDQPQVGGLLVTIGVPTPVDAGGSVNPASFQARLVYDPVNVQVVGVIGIPPWTVTPGSDVPGSGFTFKGVTTPGVAPGPLGSPAAFLKIKLVGRATATPLSLIWDQMAGDDERGGSSPISGSTISFAASGIQLAYPLPLMRGDINGDAGVNILDAAVGQRYLVQLPLPTTFNHVNFASIVHDGTGGDILTLADVQRLMRYLAGLTDAYFN